MQIGIVKWAFGFQGFSGFEFESSHFGSRILGVRVCRFPRRLLCFGGLSGFSGSAVEVLGYMAEVFAPSGVLRVFYRFPTPLCEIWV